MQDFPVAAEAVQRILLITLSNIGDAVLSTPVLESLHALYPGAVVDLVGDRRSTRIFECVPYIERIVHKEKDRGWRGLLELVRTLRTRRYDLAVDLRTDGLTYLLRARRRLTKWGRRARGAHAAERHLAVIAPLLGDPGSCPAPKVYLDGELRAFASTILSPLPGRRWLALGPGANWPGKIWPAQRYRDLVGLLQDRFDAVIVLGGPGDRAACELVSTACALPALDLCGRTDLLQAAAVLERAQVFVGNDSGLGHLASGVQTRTLTVFGPGEPERYHPWGPLADWIVEPHRDLAALDAEAVAARLRSHLAASEKLTRGEPATG